MTGAHPLLRTNRPEFELGGEPLRLVDLFCGCGGLTLGVGEAVRSKGRGLEVRLAVDFEEAALRVYQSNFPSAKTRQAAVEDLFDGELGGPLTPTERSLKRALGAIDLLVGGPPCQGHSNLNNHTRRSDPKNELYVRMARAAEVLAPRAVIIENVPAVVHSRGDVVGIAAASLANRGYIVGQSTFELATLGVAQSRKRHLLLAVRRLAGKDTSLSAILAPGSAPRRDLRWAIGDLASVVPGSFVDTPPRPSAANVARMQYLIESGQYDLPNELRPACHQGSHSYVSMYGRLKWTAPAQTITSGFGSIGQGRYMHPDIPRALTPHEAARIQGFPDYFRFDAARTRTELSVIIANAVPPQLAETVVRRLMVADVFS